MQEDTKKTYQFGSKAADKKEILAAIETCRKFESATLVWVMRHNTKGKRKEPHGLALLANARIVIPGDGGFCLKRVMGPALALRRVSTAAPA